MMGCNSIVPMDPSVHTTNQTTHTYTQTHTICIDITTYTYIERGMSTLGREGLWW